mmetsp:Transcript_61688/g.133649  ORF Transcript_61688/g.133649 Transcript_61688/m.133649 type:complete len:352 (-) Transcript_61688:167-1222(-)
MASASWRPVSADIRSQQDEASLALRLRDFLLDLGGRREASRIQFFYDQNRDAKAVMGKVEDFCERHPDLLKCELTPGSSKLVICAVLPPRAHLEQALLKAVQQAGGRLFLSSGLGSLYASDSTLRPLMKAAGGLHQVCEEMDELDADLDAGILTFRKKEQSQFREKWDREAELEALALPWKEHMDRHALLGRPRAELAKEFAVWRQQHRPAAKTGFSSIMLWLRNSSFPQYGTWPDLTRPPSSDCGEPQSVAPSSVTSTALAPDGMGENSEGPASHGAYSSTTSGTGAPESLGEVIESVQELLSHQKAAMQEALEEAERRLHCAVQKEWAALRLKEEQLNQREAELVQRGR